MGYSRFELLGLKTLETGSVVDVNQSGVCYTHATSGCTSLAQYDKMHSLVLC